MVFLSHYGSVSRPNISGDLPSLARLWLVLGRHETRLSEERAEGTRAGIRVDDLEEGLAFAHDQMSLAGPAHAEPDLGLR